MAYHEFLRNSGIKENVLHEVEYASIMSAQQSPKDEIDPLLCGKAKQVEHARIWIVNILLFQGNHW